MTATDPPTWFWLCNDCYSPERHVLTIGFFGPADCHGCGRSFVGAGEMHAQRAYCFKCEDETHDGNYWCEACGPPWRHTEGCDCEGCALMGGGDREVFGLGLGTIADTLMAVFGSGERKRAAEGRVAAEMGQRAQASFRGEPFEPDAGGIVAAGATSAAMHRFTNDERFRELLKRRRRARAGLDD